MWQNICLSTYLFYGTSFLLGYHIHFILTQFVYSPLLPYFSARMAWGSSQEATAVLVAVNYFQKHGIKIMTAGTESHSVVAEAGDRNSNRT